MKFSGPLIVVKNIEKAAKFYEDVLGLTIKTDLGGNMTLSSGHVLQEEGYWKMLLEIEDKDLYYGGNTAELYFEEDDFDEFKTHIEQFSDITFLARDKMYPWGQRVYRFYDLDKHIVEVGQSMRSIIKKLYDDGKSLEEIVKACGHPMDYVKESLACYE